MRRKIFNPVTSLALLATGVFLFNTSCWAKDVCLSSNILGVENAKVRCIGACGTAWKEGQWCNVGDAGCNEGGECPIGVGVCGCPEEMPEERSGEFSNDTK